MADLVVKYNGVTLSPTPLVQQNFQFTDFGTRWGNTQEIQLDGFITGFKSTEVATVQSGFIDLFAGNFGTLEVLEGGTSVFKWANIIVDDITCPPNHLFPRGVASSMTPYSVKMRVINVPSGVTDPVNEFAMSQGEDGVVSITHKASARGIKTSVGALDNAINFVKGFQGQNPWNNGVFIAYGSGVMTSFSENIDRAGGSYGIQETYKFNTGKQQPYFDTCTVNISDVIDNEWLNVDIDWKIQGSPVTKNISQIEALLPSMNPMSKFMDVGYTTGRLMLSNASVTRDTGAASIQLRTSYVSGYNVSDMSGYFDYIVSLSDDIVLPKEEWRIEGDYTCFGPTQFRNTQIANFKAKYSADWRGYLLGLIKASPLYEMYHDTGRLLSGTMNFDVKENTGMAQLHLSMTINDGSHPPYLLDPKYSIEVTPMRYNYDLLPSATIEGQYVLQDLQMLSQAKVGFNLSASSPSVGKGLLALSGFLPTLAQQYVATGFVISETYNTGIFDVGMTQEWLGADKLKDVILFTKVAGSVLTDYVRKPGYKFGY